MTPEDFDKLARARIDTCVRTLLEKNAEYSRGGDRLHNFKSAARMLECTPVAALRGMLVKHVVSVLDMINDMEEHGKLPSLKIVDDKLTDWINYAMLLEGLIEEERREKEGAEKALHRILGADVAAIERKGTEAQPRPWAQNIRCTDD